MNRTRLKAQLVRHEGLRLKPYRCTSGKLTIGVGRNLDDRGITEDEARYLLDTDISEALAVCHRVFGGFDTLAEARQHALVDMAFNLGETRFRGFKKMIAAVDAREWERAAAEAKDSTWYRQVGGEPGQRGHTIVAMLRTGVLP